MLYEDTIWNAGYEAGKRDAIVAADKLAFALQELLMVYEPGKTDPEWAIQQYETIATNYLESYKEAREREGETSG